MFEIHHNRYIYRYMYTGLKTPLRRLFLPEFSTFQQRFKREESQKIYQIINTLCYIVIVELLMFNCYCSLRIYEERLEKGTRAIFSPHRRERFHRMQRPWTVMERLFLTIGTT